MRASHRSLHSHRKENTFVKLAVASLSSRSAVTLHSTSGLYVWYPQGRPLFFFCFFLFSHPHVAQPLFLSTASSESLGFLKDGGRSREKLLPARATFRVSESPTLGSIIKHKRKGAEERSFGS